MPEVNSKQTTAISQEQADRIARQLNVVFNTATLYGGSHPSTRKCAGDFIKFIEKIFDITPMITLLRMGDSLYIEKCCVDQKMNSTRVVSHFQRVGIESISFRNGIVKDEVRTFIQVFSDVKTFTTVEKMSEELTKRGVTNILLNFVFLQKITKEDTVVDKESLAKKDTMQIKDDEQAVKHIGRLFSMRDMLENPVNAAHRILLESTKSDDSNYSIISQLSAINKQIREAGEEDAGLSIDEMMESFFKLTSEIKHQMEIQKEMGKIIKEEGLVIDEIDKLTYAAIIQIVRDEYKHGEISIKRLSQIIRRVMPDIKDLKKLLPQLKEALLADGMTLSDFLQLIKELNKELLNEGLIEKLEKGAEQIGLSIEDIIKAFSTNPTEAAKIIVLASEISEEEGDEESQISNMLSDYIESVSHKMTLNSPATADKKGGKILGKIIHQIETQLVEKLKERKVSEDVIKEVEKQLAERFPKTLNRLKVDWIVNIISSGEELSSLYLVKLLSTIINKKADLEVVKTPIEKALLARGLNKEQIQEVFKEIIENIEKKRRSMSLLKVIHTNKNTKFFIERLIKENMRYNNPFSCINVSVASIYRDNRWSAVSPNIISKVMPAVCAIMKEFLRDIDLIGSLGKLDENNVFIILPMTNEYGADTVKKRLEKKFSRADFELDGDLAKLDVAQSVSSFDSIKTPNYKSYIDFMKKMHKMEEWKYKL